ncbi:MAG: hypothetical protein KJ674_03325 [Nanoarchaeota archaeon]|nr:hypothetical protein [Nanoarchaeota archaeon]
MSQKTIIILICTIIPAIAVLIKWFNWWKKKAIQFWYFITRQKSRIPRETIKVVKHIRENWWNLGSINDQPAMQINGHLYVTNVFNNNIRILSAEIISPRKAKKNCVRNNVLTRHHQNNIYGSYELVPNITTELSIDFWIQPPIIKENRDLRLTIVLVDQFDNRHKIKNFIFESNAKKRLSAENNKKPDLPKETIYSIKNEIEKEVASVLKTEIERYKECGRRVGGLGSVRLKNSNSPGIGTEWRKADSPINQSIEMTPKKEYIVSDNAQALIKLFKSLKNEKDREVFVDSLLNRLSKEKEYAPVGYLIFLVLFRINKLEMAFDIAKEKLYKDSGCGFSDALRLLDGLLRFEHDEFSKDLLEKIELFIYGFDEYVFRIPERLSAIRVFRLNNITN